MNISKKLSCSIILKLISKNLKSKEVNILKCRCDEHFKSQTLLQLFKLEMKEATEEEPCRVSYCVASAEEVHSITD